MKLMEERGVKVFRYTEEELRPIKEACMATWEEMGKAGVGVELMKEVQGENGSVVSPGESFIKIRTQNF